MHTRFTSREVVGLTGISLRQLQWWDERRIVVPAREGHRRLYSTEDLAEVAVICELRRRGFSLQRVRKAIQYVEREVHVGLPPPHRRSHSLPGNLGAADRGHSQEFPPAHAGDLS